MEEVGIYYSENRLKLIDELREKRVFITFINDYTSALGYNYPQAIAIFNQILLDGSIYWIGMDPDGYWVAIEDQALNTHEIFSF